MNRCLKCGALPETVIYPSSVSLRLRCKCGQQTRWYSNPSAAETTVCEWNILNPKPGLLERLASCYARWRDEG